jgi:dTDP-4-dehydrorhamnose reductase
VDACERDSLKAERINGKATRNLARIAAELGILFVYISTDYVFNGKKGNYKETDAPCPTNAYGMSKLSGEEAVREECPEGLVIRTSIFGYNIQPKTGLAEYVINSLKNGKPMARFTDQFSTPIYTRDLSRLILKLLDRRATGLFHIGGRERVSRYDFAVRVARAFSLSPELIRPAAFVSLEGMARRPVDTSLSGDKIEAYLNDRLPKVEEGLVKLGEELRSFYDTKEEGPKDG